MFRIAVFILLLFALAFGFSWLADNPGTVTVQWDWLNKGQAYEIGLTTVVVALTAAFLVGLFCWWLVAAIINSPRTFGRWRAGRRRDKGYSTLSKGLVAAGAGNVPLAKQLAKDSGKLLENEPLVAMLEAQTALLAEDHQSARQQFNTMLERDETRLLGLRGLYMEAEQEGEVEAAAHFAREANDLAPGTPWAANAVLKVQTLTSQWEEALKTLDRNRSSGIINKEEHGRKKTVVLTALALELEDPDPEKARIHALGASKLTPDFSPAVTLAARLLIRLNDNRKAGKILEKAWSLSPHPEIAEAYVNLHSGDTATQKLARANRLAHLKPSNTIADLFVARTALDAGEFKQARDSMEKVLKENPSEQACLLMADIEQAEYGDRGRVREWLSRAVSAPKDTAWIADGVVSIEWQPRSPVTGRLDAFEWKTPMQQLGAQNETLDLSLLANEPLADSKPVESSTAKTDNHTEANDKTDENIIEAEIIETDKTRASPENDNVVPDISDSSIPQPDTSKKEEPLSQADVTAAGSQTSGDSAIAGSPYKQANLDSDQDGLIDHRPDDPGVNVKEDQKKGWLF
ncbi:MAG: heme biosynthesis protein HemY [Rhizobiaceae bacterium]